MSVINSENRRRCCMCGISPAEDSLITLFRFPKPGATNTLRCALWAKYCFPDKEYWSTKFQHKLHSQHKMLCNRHFPRTSFSDYPETSKKLHRFAVPVDIMETEPPQPGLPLHRFPNPNNPAEIERFRTWIMKIGGDIIGEDNKFIHKNRKVCHKHFEKVYTFPNMKLTALAIPTLEIPGGAITNNQKADPQPQILATHSIDLKNEKPPDLSACEQSAPPSVPVGDESPRAALCDAMLSSADDDVPEPSPPPPPLLDLHTAQMCRVCLALDVKMFHLGDTELKIMFHSITGIEFEDNEGSTLGSLICWECAARLRAASTFRSKALLSDTLLQRLINKGEQIENDYFEKVKEEADRLVPPKTLTATEIVHIVDIEEQNNVSQLVYSGDDDKHSILDSSDTHKSIMEENFLIVVVGDDNVVTASEIENHSTYLKTEVENITKVIDENPKILPEIHHTAHQSDLTSSQEDSDDQMIKTFIESIAKSKTVPEQNIEVKITNKRRKEAVSNDRASYLKEDSEDGNKKKKLKTYGGTSKKVSRLKSETNTQVI